MAVAAVATPVYRSRHGGWTDDPDGLDLAYLDVLLATAIFKSQGDWVRVNNEKRALAVLDKITHEERLAQLGDPTAMRIAEDLDLSNPPILECGHRSQGWGAVCESRADPDRPGCRRQRLIGYAWSGRCLVCDPSPEPERGALAIPNGIVGPRTEPA